MQSNDKRILQRKIRVIGKRRITVVTKLGKCRNFGSPTYGWRVYFVARCDGRAV